MKIKYRKLHKYKYQLTKPYCKALKIYNYSHHSRYLTICNNGMLYIKKYYAWDGPSGPTIDTKTFMRGSLVHDALYQLMRINALPDSYRKYADKLLRQICREDGMSWLRAWYVYKCVRLFAGKYVRGENESA